MEPSHRSWEIVLHFQNHRAASRNWTWGQILYDSLLSCKRVPAESYSGTSECKDWSFKHDGKILTLIDTPGFDDTSLDDMEILASIASRVEAKNLPRIVGVIYFHRITDKRLTGMSRMNLQISRAICGEQFYPHIILVTTMWNTIPNETVTNEAVEREKQLLQLPAFWGDMIAQRCKYDRFLGTPESGIHILTLFQSLDKAPLLHIEVELRVKGFKDTNAAAVILEERRRRERARLEEMEELRKEEEEKLREEMAERARLRERKELMQKEGERWEQQYQAIVGQQSSQPARGPTAGARSDHDRPFSGQSHEGSSRYPTGNTPERVSSRSDQSHEDSDGYTTGDARGRGSSRLGLGFIAGLFPRN
ncbi:hypothetical protein GP486_004368 [Trichoglossum hirsutum]|uniref:G domain-containing protein n=1 Tax=Trichoglossum hirsutum TaxID=265104 RepID=A0A9P8LB74_9PEZI|nr:hypothetical protein GP486_004368 [Trichoglossum hirsutum]